MSDNKIIRIEQLEKYNSKIQEVYFKPLEGKLVNIEGLIGTGFIGNSLEIGSGELSIQQKSTLIPKNDIKDGDDPSNIETFNGDFSNINPRSGANGKYSVALGWGNSAMGRSNFIAGSRNYTNQNEASAVGQGHYVDSKYAFASGGGNIILNGSNYSAVFGSSNKLENQTCSIVNGQANIISNGQNLLVSGRHNISSGLYYGAIIGYSNTIYTNDSSFGSIILGDYNTSSNDKPISSRNTILGYNNTLNKGLDRVNLIGTGLLTNDDLANTTIIGSYNEIPEKITIIVDQFAGTTKDIYKDCFIVAGGVNEDNRYNLFTIPSVDAILSMDATTREHHKATLACGIDIDGDIISSGKGEFAGDIEGRKLTITESLYVKANPTGNYSDAVGVLYRNTDNGLIFISNIAEIYPLNSTKGLIETVRELENKNTSLQSKYDTLEERYNELLSRISALEENKQ